jgi:YD repeat-containing protein
MSTTLLERPTVTSEATRDSSVVGTHHTFCDAEGWFCTFVWDDEGRVSSLTDSAGWTYKYSYECGSRTVTESHCGQISQYVLGPVD